MTFFVKAHCVNCQYPFTITPIQKGKRKRQVVCSGCDAVLLSVEKDGELIQLTAYEEVKAHYKLYNYQVEGKDFLVNIERGILGDDMGLGKTLEALAASNLPDVCRVLIVCPNSVKGVWDAEIRRWLGSDKTISIIGKGSREEQQEIITTPSDFTILNYDIIGTISYRDPETKLVVFTDRRHLDLIANQRWDVIIFDEAHRMKNRKSKAFIAAKKICSQSRAKRIYLLTGTPVQNKPQDIWTLLNLIRPNEYSSFWGFIQRFCKVTRCRWNAKALDIGEVMIPQILKAELDKVMLRRLRTDVWEDMPELIIKDHLVTLPQNQRALYQKMEDEMYVEISSTEEINATTVLAQILRLKQMSVSPDLLRECPPLLKGAKIDALFDIIEDSGDQKIIVFSQFRKAIKTLELQLKEYNPAVLVGGMKREDVDECINRFQTDPKCKLFLTTIQCGGEGITLTAATIAVFLDHLWTPAKNAQAVARAHRTGQKNAVTVINLVAENTIEHKIQKLLGDKQAMFDSIIPETKIISSALQAVGRNKC